jgi:hypothetical protein
MPQALSLKEDFKILLWHFYLSNNNNGIAGVIDSPANDAILNKLLFSLTLVGVASFDSYMVLHVEEWARGRGIFCKNRRRVGQMSFRFSLLILLFL